MRKVIGRKIEDNTSIEDQSMLHMKTAIRNILAPQMTKSTLSVIERSHARKRRIPSAGGIILTEDDIMNELEKRKRVETVKEKSQHTKINVKSICTKMRKSIFSRLSLSLVWMCTFGNVRRQPPNHLHKVKGDGNCFLRALSYCLTGSEEEHQSIRVQVVNHVLGSRKSYLESFLTQSLDHYVTKSKVRNSGVSATESEILGVAITHCEINKAICCSK